MQLLPCGHSMCENCYGNTYPRGTKRLHCVFCRKAFASSAAFRCPVALSHQLRRDDPKYGMVCRCLARLHAHAELARAQAGRDRAQRHLSWEEDLYCRFHIPTLFCIAHPAGKRQ